MKILKIALSVLLSLVVIAAIGVYSGAFDVAAAPATPAAAIMYVTVGER